MPEETVETQVQQPVVETPVAPAVEALDAEGVPYKNRAEEYRRKFEAEQTLNQRYQTELGQRVQQPAPVQSGGNTVFEHGGRTYEYDAASVAFIQKMTNDQANVIVGRAQLSQEASDPEIRSEAESIYRNEIASNGFYASFSDDAKQTIAIKEAKARVFQKRFEAAKKGTLNQAQASAVAAQAAGASIPGTVAGAAPSPTGKDQYIKEFVQEHQSDPQKAKIFSGFYKLDPRSPEGIEKLKRSAEFAYNGIEFGGKTGAAIEHMTRGGR